MSHSMRKFAVLTLVCLLAGAVFAVTGPKDRQPTDPRQVTSQQNPSARPVPVDDLLFSRRVGGPAWSPDGREIVFTTNLTGRTNLWKVTSNGGWPIQLVQADDRQTSATWSPDGKSIYYIQDTGGNEQWQIWRVPADGGSPENLTKNDQMRYEISRFSPDGKLLAISMKLKTAPTSDLGVFDLQSRQARKLTNEETKDHSWNAVAWSPDGKFLYAVRGNAGFTDSDLYRIDTAGGAAENLTQHTGQRRIVASDLSRDGKLLLVTSNEKGGFENVGLLDVASKQLQWITDTQWEAIGGDFAPDGRHLTYVVNQDGRTTAYLYDVASKNSQKLNFPEGLTSPAGNPSAFSPDGARMLVNHQDAQHPPDLWVYSVPNARAQQLTFSAIASLNPQALPPSTIVHYKSFDGQIISALFWMPFNLKRDGSNPAVVLPHGGPTGQTVDSFNSVAAALASRGYICIAPNVRGSTGYGLDFQKGNFKDLGGGDLQDEVYATRFLVDTGYVDAKKIGITGGSYGGYITLMAVGKTPDVWAAAVEEYGIVDWYTMLQHEDPFLQEYEKTLLGDPEKDRAVYEAASPIKFLRSAKAPLLVLQGENDIRVPKEEAEQVVQIYKSIGKTVDAKFYPQEGHGFAKRENQVDALRRTIQWFDKYLKSGGTAAGE
jgi:dipeptidyl aminopeptidase/acylaminoacyl peptidase